MLQVDYLTPNRWFYGIFLFSLNHNHRPGNLMDWLKNNWTITFYSTFIKWF